MVDDAILTVLTDTVVISRFGRMDIGAFTIDVLIPQFVFMAIIKTALSFDKILTYLWPIAQYFLLIGTHS